MSVLGRRAIAFAFNGWPAATVFGILGAAAAATIVLYLLKLRRRRVHVPFVPLWHAILSETQTTRLFSQLKRWLSLLIALCVVSSLAFALGDPRSEAIDEDARTLVVLVDASASMQATDVEPTRFEAAQDQARALVDGLGPADAMLIAQLDSRAAPLSPLTSDDRALKDAIDRLEVSDGRADLRAGLRLALDILRGRSKPEIVILSDGGFDLERFDPAPLIARAEEAGVRLSWVKVGRGDRNVGISAFSVRRYPLDKSQSEVLLELFNPQDEPESVEIELLGDGAAVDIQTLTVAPGERLRRFFQNISGVDQTLEARIRLAEGQTDQLPVDDHAFARLPERRRAKVCVVSEGNLYLQAALLLDEYLNVTEITPAQWPPSEAFDVTIFDRWAPLETPQGASIYLGLPGDAAGAGAGPLRTGGVIEGPYFTQINRRHPIFQWTALSDINIADAREVSLERGDVALGRSGSDPLIVLGTRDAQPFLALTFDITRSDFPLRVAWPLFLLNAIDYFVQEQAGFVSSFAVGDTWRLPVDPALSVVTIVDPRGHASEVPVTEGEAIFTGALAGFYEAKRGETLIDRFAVNLGALSESQIAPQETLTLARTAAQAPSRGQTGVRRELWLYLVIFALAILCVEWWTFHRRVTV